MTDGEDYKEATGIKIEFKMSQRFQVYLYMNGWHI